MNCEIQCGRKAVVETEDGGYFCESCAKECVIHCVDCKELMVYTVSIYYGEDNKPRCQLCDQEYEEKLLQEVTRKYWK